MYYFNDFEYFVYLVVFIFLTIKKKVLEKWLITTTKTRKQTFKQTLKLNALKSLLMDF